MKKLTTTTSIFRRIVTRNYLYVDKTKHIYDLINADDYFFLSRPRRFGKSLLVSTLKELFAGNRELFKGLWIDSSDYGWPKHSVISLDFSSLKISNSEAFEKSLAEELNDVAESFGLDVSVYPDPGEKLKKLVRRLAKENPVVVLIDEYDHPLINNIDELEIAKKNSKVVNSFFAVLKSLQDNIHFILITGVSQFSKATIFSGLNNLKDISLKPIAATLLGYTTNELDSYFSYHIQRLALLGEVTEMEIREKIRLWYNGYQFSKESEKVYNPFSIQHLFNENEFANYWFKSGIPSVLVQLMADKNYTLENIEQREYTTKSLETFPLEELPLVTLLFQTGFLTIKEYDKENDTYTLTFPNHEVRESFCLHTLSDTYC